MKYGVVLGKHQDISRAELQAQGFIITKQYDFVSILDNADEKQLAQLSGIVKWGIVKEVAELEASDLIGVSERELGTHLKKAGLCKRFKEVGTMHTDEEVKEKGKEYVMLDDDIKYVLEVTGYQGIARFSCIDFDKPINSMQIGMMPAKLTQIMVNIAVGRIKNEELKIKNEVEGETSGSKASSSQGITVYDPFMGLGTTYMVANSMGYNVIGSDINITPAKQNLTRWKSQEFAHDLPITLFAHDATKPLEKPFLKHASCIVTEGRLGHIITGKTKAADIAIYAKEVQNLYNAWLSQTREFYPHMTIVCSMPWYTGADNTHIDNILEHCEDLEISVSQIKQVYTRTGQKVGRKIVILQR